VLLLEVTVSDLVTKESEGPREYATSMLRPCSPEVYLKASAVFVRFGFGSDAELRMVPPRPRAKLSSWTWNTAAESRSVSEASPRASKVARRIEFSSMPARLVREGEGGGGLGEGGAGGEGEGDGGSGIARRGMGRHFQRTTWTHNCTVLADRQQPRR